MASNPKPRAHLAQGALKAALAFLRKKDPRIRNATAQWKEAANNPGRAWRQGTYQVVDPPHAQAEEAARRRVALAEADALKDLSAAALEMAQEKTAKAAKKEG